MDSSEPRLLVVLLRLRLVDKILGISLFRLGVVSIRAFVGYLDPKRGPIRITGLQGHYK